MSTRRRVEITLIRDRAHYDEVVMGAIAKARVSVWISTANVKGVRVEAPIGSRARARGAYVSLLETRRDDRVRLERPPRVDDLVARQAGAP